MIDADSPAGSYRAALNPAATCAACRQSVCGHSDLVFAGLVPPREPAQDFGRERTDALAPAEPVSLHAAAFTGEPAAASSGNRNSISRGGAA